jgi:hypothetical protein
MLNQISKALSEAVQQAAFIIHRFLKFSRWFPGYFVAWLLRINKLPLSPSQRTDVC